MTPNSMEEVNFEKNFIYQRKTFCHSLAFRSFLAFIFYFILFVVTYNLLMGKLLPLAENIRLIDKEAGDFFTYKLPPKEFYDIWKCETKVKTIPDSSYLF